MKKIFLLYLVVAFLPLAGCSNSTSNTKEQKNDLVLHGKTNPSNDVGNDYDVYLNENTFDLFQKNNGIWFPSETKGNNSFFNHGEKKQKRLNAEINDSETLYKAMINTFLCTNDQVLFEMYYALPHNYTEQDLETAMYSLSRYTFDKGMMVTETANSREDLKNEEIINTSYGKYDVNTGNHYYSSDKETWIYIDPNNPSSFMYKSISTTCIDKTFEFSGIDNGLAGLFVGEQFTRADNKYIFNNIPLEMSILANIYTNFDGAVNGTLTLSDDGQYVSSLKLELIWEGEMANQGHLEGVSLINCEFFGFKEQEIR